MPCSLLDNGNTAVSKMLNVLVFIKLSLLKGKSGNVLKKGFCQIEVTATQIIKIS